MQKRALSPLLVPLLLSIAAFFAVFTVADLCYLPRLIDGDIYADMLLAREIWRQKALFPANWVYGNQYYTVATPVLAALFYGLTGSMNTAMALATAMMSALIVLSFCWMLRPFVRRSSTVPAALLTFLAAPMAYDMLQQPQGQLFFTLASYYACYLIVLCLVFGDYARSALLPEQGARPAALALALALSFLTGMQSLRQTLIMVFPILGVEALRLLRRRSRRATLLRALGYAVANAAGYLCMELLQVPTHSIYGEVRLSGSGLGGRLLAVWHAVRAVTGLDAALFQPPMAFFLPFFLLSVALAVWGGIRLFRRRRETPGLWLLALLCALSLAGVLAAGVAVEIHMREIYLFVWYLLLALLLAGLWEGLREKWLPAAVAALCLLSLGDLYCSYGSSLRMARERDPAPAVAFCEDAEAAGIRLVYGDWETIPKLLVWSDGKITGGFWDEPLFQIRGSINLLDIYAPEDNDHALYVIGPWGREETERYIREQGASFEVFGEYGPWIAYRIDRQLMHPEGEPLP